MMQQAISLDPSRFTDMQIILVRHGRPDHGAARWSTPIGMKAWVARYNAAAVATGERPDSLVELAGSVGIVVCSSLQRCVESRSQLACDCCQEPDPLFAEAHLPYPDWGCHCCPRGSGDWYSVAPGFSASPATPSLSANQPNEPVRRRIG